MPKVITLERAADGTYVVPDNPVVESVDEETEAEKTVRGYETYCREAINAKRKTSKNKKTHEFIVNNGEKTANFLSGVQKTVKILMLAKKFMR